MITRNYSVADSRLLEHTGVILQALTMELPTFTALDPDLNEALVTALNENYVTTLEEGGDDVARGKVGAKTQLLLEEVKKSDSLIKQLRYWIKKTYEKDAAGLKRFQLTKYWKVRNRTAELVAYLNALATVVAEQRTSLEASNTPAALLDEIAVLAKSIETANSEQENSKAGRRHDTQARIQKLNAIHSTCRKFSDAAEFVFEGNVAQRELYRIPGNSQPSTDDEEPIAA